MLHDEEINDGGGSHTAGVINFKQHFMLVLDISC